LNLKGKNAKNKKEEKGKEKLVKMKENKTFNSVLLF